MAHALLVIVIALLTMLQVAAPPFVLDIISTNLGALTLSPRDANGVPLDGLTAAQFMLREDDGADVPAQQVEPFTDASARISLVLVIDTSASMTGKPLADAQAAARQLLAALAPDDRAAVIAFSSKVSLADPFPQFDSTRERGFGTDKAGLMTLVDGLHAGGNTALYDAAFKAARLAGQETGARRAVILLTDGRDEVGGGALGSGSAVANADSAVFEANRNRIPFFTIGLGTGRDEAFLKRLALQTGGVYQDAPDSAQLAAQFQNALQRLKLAYRVTYKSALKEDGAAHRIRVTLNAGDETLSAETTISMPAGADVPTPAAVATATPLATPTNTPEPIVTVVATVTPEVTGGDSSPLTWVVVAVAGVAAVFVVGFLLSRRPKERKCMRCGFHPLAEDAKKCPACGAQV